jgi:hypothetical protein
MSERPRKRAPKGEKKSLIKEKEQITNITIQIDDTQEPPRKKRGRKPKGGKIITKDENEMKNELCAENVILHLKCSMKDLNDNNTDNIVSIGYDPSVPPEIKSYEKGNQPYTQYEENEDNNFAYVKENTTMCSKCKNCSKDKVDQNETNISDIMSKLKLLKIQLHKNVNQDKKSDCFWCTYDFDNEACYIPMSYFGDELQAYGNFCRPECAVAYLMSQSIDDSIKFERYNMLNSIYSKTNNYKKNIKPAPSPYYTLDKYYGNLTIHEYRRLLKSDHLLLTIDKPMTRIMPELYEDNDVLVANVYGCNSNNQNETSRTVYKVKRQSEKKEGPSKAHIMKSNFGLG